MSFRKKRFKPKNYWFPTQRWKLDNAAEVTIPVGPTATVANVNFASQLILGDDSASTTQELVLEQQDKMVLVERIVGNFYMAFIAHGLTSGGAANVVVDVGLAVMKMDSTDAPLVDLVQMNTAGPQFPQRQRVFHTQRCVFSLENARLWLASSGYPAGLITQPVGGFQTEVGIKIPLNFGKVDVRPRVHIRADEGLFLTVGAFATATYTHTGDNLSSVSFFQDLRVLGRRHQLRRR